MKRLLILAISLGLVGPVWADLFIAGQATSGVTIGSPVSGGTATRVLFIDGSGNVANDADFVFSTDTLTVTKISTPTIELGTAATDTTLTRSAAGIAALEGIDIVNVSTTQNLSNKTFTNNVTLSGTTGIIFSSSALGFMAASTTQTPDTSVFYTGSTSNALHIKDFADAAHDGNNCSAGTSAATDPLLCIHSHNQTTTEWVDISHDGSNPHIRWGAGDLFFEGPAGLGTDFAKMDYDTGMAVKAGWFIGFTSGTITAALDVVLSRAGAGRLQLGIADGPTPVNQSIEAQGATGTDIAGGSLTLSGGVGTGTGASGNVILSTSPALATGTTVQTLEPRFRVVGKQFTLTDNTAATFLTIALGNDTGGGGTLDYCIKASDATNEQMECGSVHFVGVDETAGAGGETCGTPAEVSAQALGAGTLATTFATTTGTDLCNLRVTADSSLTPTTLWIKYSITHNSGQTITPQ